MSLFRKNQEFKMDVNVANATLQNVFEACDKGPNTVPFDKLLLRCKYNGIFYDTCIILAVLLLAITLVAPMRFLPAYVHRDAGHISLVTHEQYGDSLLISISDKNIDVTKCFYTDMDGNVTYAKSFNSIGQTVGFPFPSTEVTITITTKSGEELFMLFTPDR